MHISITTYVCVYRYLYVLIVCCWIDLIKCKTNTKYIWKQKKLPLKHAREASNQNLTHKSISLIHKLPPDEDEEPRCTQLTNRHKIAIRFIRKVTMTQRIPYNIPYHIFDSNFCSSSILWRGASLRRPWSHTMSRTLWNSMRRVSFSLNNNISHYINNISSTACRSCGFTGSRQNAAFAVRIRNICNENWNC